MSESKEMPEAVLKYNHQELTDHLDVLNRQLEAMKETMLNTSVRAHLLEADLSTLYNPAVAEALHQVKEDCASCTHSIYGRQTKY